VDVWEVGEVWEPQPPLPKKEPDEDTDAESQHSHRESKACHGAGCVVSPAKNIYHQRARWVGFGNFVM